MSRPINKPNGLWRPIHFMQAIEDATGLDFTTKHSGRMRFYQLQHLNIVPAPTDYTKARRPIALWTEEQVQRTVGFIVANIFKGPTMYQWRRPGLWRSREFRREITQRVGRNMISPTGRWTFYDLVERGIIPPPEVHIGKWGFWTDKQVEDTIALLLVRPRRSRHKS